MDGRSNRRNKSSDFRFLDSSGVLWRGSPKVDKKDQQP